MDTKKTLLKIDTLIAEMNTAIDNINAKFNIANPNVYVNSRTPGGILYNDMPLYNGKELYIPGNEHDGITVISREETLAFMGITLPPNNV